MRRRALGVALLAPPVLLVSGAARAQPPSWPTPDEMDLHLFQVRTTVGRIVIGLTRPELAALGTGPMPGRVTRALEERGEVEAWLYDTGPEDRDYRAVGRVTLQGRIVISVGAYVPARPIRLPP